MRLLRNTAPYLLVGVVALLLRVLHLDAFPNSDEINFWLDRSRTFAEAIATGNPADTAISTHPGVTTMWLGSAGMLLHHTLNAWGLIEITRFPAELAIIRLPLALTHTAGVLVGMWLLRRMLPFATATLAALLWATDPFVLAMSRMLHVDGLMTTFATLSLLAACDYWYHSQQRGMLLLSGSTAALAILSKSPALALGPVVAVVALTAPTAGQRLLTRSAVRSACAALLLWGGALLLTLLLVWPATWSDPLRVYELLRIGVEVEGSTGHVIGNFFLGRPDPEPGVRFYPVALALRMTPWTMVGIFLLLPGMKREQWDGRAGQVVRTIAVLAGFTLLFTVAMSIFPKKLNRYLVPVFPALNIMAAVGLAWGIERLSAIGYRLSAIGYRLLAVVAVGNAAWWHPYTIAYFNQALGGAEVGAQTFLVGEGDGLGEVAAWLNAQPDITGVVTASTMINSLRPYMRHGAQVSSPPGDELADNTGYVVVYIRHTQRGPLAAPFDQFYPAATPLHTVRIHGVEYAWIYQVPPRMAHPLEARFGQAIALRGYEVEHIRATGVLSVTLQWQAAAPVAEDYRLFVHVLDEEGTMIGQTDAPPAGPAAPTHTWQPGRAITWSHPVPIAADVATGRFWLSLGLYHPKSLERLPLHTAPVGNAQPGAARPPPPDDGEHALLLPLTLP